MLVRCFFSCTRLYLLIIALMTVTINTKVLAQVPTETYDNTDLTIVSDEARNEEPPSAEDDSIKVFFSLPTDPLLPLQWYFRNEGFTPDAPGFRLRPGADANIFGAWIRLGNLGSSNVTVAVIDDGVLPHPDLTGKIVAPYDVYAGTNTPHWAGSGEHGTAIATLILGAANDHGIVGVAPNSRLMPINGLTGNSDRFRKMFEHAVKYGADIINCSWGTTEYRQAPDAMQRQAIQDAAVNGRQGKGSVVVFSAGNEGLDYYNLYSDSRHVIIVGASTSSDNHANYSNKGNGITVVAPSDGEWPVYAGRAFDLTSNGQASEHYKYGVDHGPHYRHFGGTSAAAAIVSGICALILSANPDLTAAEVKKILELTADKIGSSSEYDITGYSPRYGYGRVNAESAVIMALNW